MKQEIPIQETDLIPHITENSYGDYLVSCRGDSGTFPDDLRARISLANQEGKLLVCTGYAVPPVSECSYVLSNDAKPIYGNWVAWIIMPQISNNQMFGGGLCWILVDPVKKDFLNPWILLHRSKSTHGLWVNPTGLCKRNETPLSTALYIFKQVTDLDIEAISREISDEISGEISGEKSGEKSKENSSDISEPIPKKSACNQFEKIGDIQIQKYAWANLHMRLTKQIFMFIQTNENSDTFSQWFKYHLSGILHEKEFRVKDSELLFVPVKKILDDSSSYQIQSTHHKAIRKAYQLMQQKSSFTLARCPKLNDSGLRTNCTA